MAQPAIFKRSEKPERRQKPVYFAFEVLDEPGVYRCPSVATWPMSRAQLQAWGDGADVEIRFVDHQRPASGDSPNL
jgi:hypothetical protein